MKNFSLLASLLLFFNSMAAAQQGQYWIYGQNVEDRASTRIGYWHKNVNAGLGEVVVSYGRPAWKKDYEKKLDEMTKGKIWRMGSNYWSLLDSTLPVRLSGVRIDPGLYFLAVRRSQDGTKWELLFIDHEKSRQKGLDAYDVGTRPDEIPILFTAPLTFEKRKTVEEQLTVLLSLNQGSETEGLMELTWGDFALTAPVSVELPSP